MCFKINNDIITNFGLWDYFENASNYFKMVTLIRFGKVLQIGTMENEVYLFDIASNKDLFKEVRLGDLLQSEKTVKVNYFSKFRIFRYLQYSRWKENRKETIWCNTSTQLYELKA